MPPAVVMERSASTDSNGGTRVAVVTGGASGIGWAISQALAAEGFRLVIIGRSDAIQKKAEALSRAGRPAIGVQVDLADTAAIPALTARILAEAGRCDVLINNAGAHIKKPDGQRIRFEDVSLTEWAVSLALHMTAPMLLCQAFLPGMKERRWGRIINVSSRAARTFTIQSSVPYAASKAGNVGLTRAIAGECAPFGVTCNNIAPGRIRTPMTDVDTGDMKHASLSGIPIGRIGEPIEIGAAVRFLASDHAGFITGVVLDMNGGAFMAP
jgi:3-oxoacyl-[acyl-carrier protein] reductase